jgi:8-oxo-dGTP pyrophosphatase MutT (NUDIX family)
VPALEGDRTRWVDRPIREASVLIALTQSGGVLLTERSASMRDHAGQVALPGGRIEPTDRDAVDAAFREAREEIGLDPGRLDALGLLPAYLTGSGYRVQAVVALVVGDLDLHGHLLPDPREVASIFEVPLSFLLEPRNHRRHYWQAPEGLRAYYSMPWFCDRREAMRLSCVSQGGEDSASGREFFIWGATAAMLRNFYHLLHAHRDVFPIEL